MKHTNAQQDDDAGQNNRYHIAARLWRPYRSAFRRPMSLSDEDDSETSFNHPIGDVDAVGEPNGIGE
jgi:hypothetical protein